MGGAPPGPCCLVPCQTCRLQGLDASPEAAGSHLHENELGAQRGHIWKLLSEAQHHPAVGKPVLAVVELLQLCGDTSAGEGVGESWPCDPPRPGGLRAFAPELVPLRGAPSTESPREFSGQRPQGTRVTDFTRPDLPGGTRGRGIDLR